MSSSVITGDFGELVIGVERIEVSSVSPRPDKNWRYTDAAGHEHYWQGGGYPTLTYVIDETYWSDDLQDEVSDGHWECEQCGETITPGMVGPSLFREFAPGRRSYMLNGEPITEERAKQIMEAARPSDSPVDRSVE